MSLTDNASLQGGLHGALAGLRVIDLTGVVLGPYATQILGDYGADAVSYTHLTLPTICSV